MFFTNATGRLVFIRHGYIGEAGEVAASHAVVIGGDEAPAFPLTADPPLAVTLHQAAERLPPFDALDGIDATTAERLWRDRQGCSVLIGHTEEGRLRPVTVGGSEPEFPFKSRDAEVVLMLGGVGGRLT